MRAFWHDTWGAGRGPAVGLSPAMRLLAGTLLFAACMLAPTASLPGAALAAAIALAWLGICRPPWRFIRAVLLLALVVLSPYFLLVALLSDGTPPETPYAMLIAAASLLLRGMSGLLVSAVTLTTLRISELDEALAALPVPRAVSAILVQIVHQTALLAYETRRVAAGMSVRGASTGRRAAWRLVASLPRVWLPRVVQRADRVAAAMELRGFCESMVCQRPRACIAWRDVLALALVMLVLAATIAVRLGRLA
jgi:energy-coupling factor transporter transmembrane protein EcfT